MIIYNKQEKIVIIPEGGGSTSFEPKPNCDELIAEAREEGYESGLTYGLTSGYSAGYSSGKTDGYEEGYDAGIQDCPECDCSSAITWSYQSGWTNGFAIGINDGTGLVEYDVFFDLPYSSSTSSHLKNKTDVKLNGVSPFVENDTCTTWWPVLSADRYTFKSKSVVFYQEITAITSIDINIYGTDEHTLSETFERITINGVPFNITGQSFTYVDDGEERIFTYHLDGEMTYPPKYYTGLISSIYLKISGCTGFTSNIVTGLSVYFKEETYPYVASFPPQNHYGKQTDNVGEYAENFTFTTHNAYDWGQYYTLDRIIIYFPKNTISGWESGWSVEDVRLNGYANQYENTYLGGYSLKIDMVSPPYSVVYGDFFIIYVNQ